MLCFLCCLCLELLISGLPDIDLDDLRAHTDYHGYKPTDLEISQFWSVLRSFSKEETALFLQFVTGTSKVGQRVGRHAHLHIDCDISTYLSIYLSIYLCMYVCICMYVCMPYRE